MTGVHMIVRIARKESLDMTRDGRFRLSAGLVLGLLLTALIVGGTHARDVRRQHEFAQERARNDWESQEAKHPHAAAHYGMYVFKPKSPLSFVDEGVDPYTGVSVHLEAHKRTSAQHRPARDATSLQRAGELTAAAVLQGLVPLLIIFLTFSAFAGEREQGTLRQILSLGVRPRDLAIGKALGIATALGTVLVPAALIGTAALVLNGGGAGDSTLPRLGAMVAAYLAYHAAFVGIGLAVSATARSSRSALVGLLGFWICGVLIAPRLAADLAAVAEPTPSPLEFSRAIEHDLKAGISGHDSADARIEELKRETLKKYNVESIEDLPVDFNGIVLQAGEEHGNRVYDEHFGRVADAFAMQDLYRQLMSLLAPSLAIRSLSAALAGTDNAHHRAFAEAAERYRNRLVRSLNQDMIDNAEGLGNAYAADRSLWEAIPHFHHSLPGVGAVLADQPFAIAGLLGWLVLAVVAAGQAVARLRID